MRGKYVIVRSSPSGCWAGTLASRDGGEVVLTDARRLWRWWAAEGVSLSGVAARGLDTDRQREIRVAASVNTAIIRDVCEILEASGQAAEQIKSWEVSRGD